MARVFELNVLKLKGPRAIILISSLHSPCHSFLLPWVTSHQDIYCPVFSNIDRIHSTCARPPPMLDCFFLTGNRPRKLPVCQGVENGEMTARHTLDAEGGLTVRFNRESEGGQKRDVWCIAQAWVRN